MTVSNPLFPPSPNPQNIPRTTTTTTTTTTSTTPSISTFFPFVIFILSLTSLALLSTSTPKFPGGRGSINPSLAVLPTKYAIVAACRNRHVQLEEAARSWVRVRGVSQVVVVDWASDPPLRGVLRRVVGGINATDPVQVKVVRVEAEQDWVLTRAYNLGVREVSVDYVFKVDCDYVVGKRAVETHRLDEIEGRKGGVFFTGYYMNARDANEMHLNGALVVSQRDFWSVGGYDERIQSYGYDDEELYSRLTKVGVKRLNVSYQEVSHLAHGDDQRAQKHVRFPRAQIDMNKLLLEKVGKVWGKESRRSEYERVEGSLDAVTAVFVPVSLDQLVEEKENMEVWKLAVGQRLRDDYQVPWGVISQLQIVEAEKLLANLNHRKVEVGVDEVKHKGLGVRWVLVHVQNGLGNRLRVLSSALAFARKTGMEVIVVWEKDVHFGAFYGDIFNQTVTPFAVMDSLDLKWPLKNYIQYDDAWRYVEFYNYMEKEDTGKLVLDDEEKNIYFKSAAIMQTEGLTSWDTENEELKRLKVHGYISGMVTEVVRGGFDNVCGVHIRNRSLDEDIRGVKDNREMYAKEDAALIDKWRAMTKHTSFLTKMRDLLKEGNVDRFFVASDTVGVLYKMKELFEDGEVVVIDRKCDDRSGKCEQYAMADMLVLARTKILLGSTWSSFTEAAMRFGGPKALLAGTDFGPRPEDEENTRETP